MTVKAKAKELVDMFEPMCLKYRDAAKKCALISVEQIIVQLDEIRKPEYTDFWHGENAGETVDGYFIKEYWEEVKQEINNL